MLQFPVQEHWGKEKEVTGRTTHAKALSHTPLHHTIDQTWWSLTCSTIYRVVLPIFQLLWFLHSFLIQFNSDCSFFQSVFWFSGFLIVFLLQKSKFVVL